MDKSDTGTGGISETELVGLLAAMKVEPAPEADFETRFLHDLRERLACESVCCPARRLFWEHVLQLFLNFGPRKLAYGASTLGLGALALGFFALPNEEEVSGAAVAAKSTLTRLERSLAALRPNAGQETQACTTIRICEQKKAPYTDAGLASGGLSTTFGFGAAAEFVPANIGVEASMLDSFPSYTTAVGF